MTNFPTNKPHISYSEVRTWKECSWRHKLQQIDKIDTFEVSPFLDYGTIVHEACEHFLKTRELDLEKMAASIRQAWEKRGYDSDEYINKQKLIAEAKGNKPWPHNYVDSWVEWATNAISDLPAFMDKAFPGWEYVAAEQELYEAIPNDDLKFKGFIDGIIKTPTPRGGWRGWIIDWKTAPKWGWHANKKRDVLVTSQLALYKNYWVRKYNVNPKDIHCGFVLLKRDAPPGQTCELVKVSVGPKAAAKADKLVANMISSVRRGLFFKNRDSCKYCEFLDTKHCP
ncbi:MAG: hypothetical protein CME70_06380 [Halobacteriovorax sp.]|nr:hypothetical protein [Halobacteriovorax sp.]|tara:strand:- start:257 stop:1105 length:849 start_codon:yes stop_codon:yes gene_type:complete